MKKQGKRGYKKSRGEDRGRGSEGTKQGYRGVKRGGEQILSVYHKP